MTRPTRSSGTPRALPSGDAATPAAQSTVPADRRSLPNSTTHSEIPVTALFFHTSTPSRASDRSEAWRSDSGEGREDVRPGLDEDHPRRPRLDVPELLLQGVPRNLGHRPASSTPVGPPPTTAKVRSRRRSSASAARSARSNASSIRRRTRRASSSVLRPGAGFSHSSCPK